MSKLIFCFAIIVSTSFSPISYGNDVDKEIKGEAVYNTETFNITLRGEIAENLWQFLPISHDSGGALDTSAPREIGFYHVRCTSKKGFGKTCKVFFDLTEYTKAINQ
jgi:hypothetical protein